MRWNLIIGDEVVTNLRASASESSVTAKSKKAVKSTAKEAAPGGVYLALHLGGRLKTDEAAKAVTDAIRADPLSGLEEFGKGLVKPKAAVKSLLRAVLKASAGTSSQHPFVFVPPRAVTESQQDTTVTSGGKGEPRIHVVDIEFRIPMDRTEAQRLLDLFERNSQFAAALAPYVHDTLRSWFAAIVK